MSRSRDETGDFEGVVQFIPLKHNSADSAKHAYLVKFDDNIFLGSQISNATAPSSPFTPPLFAPASLLRLPLRAAATVVSPKNQRRKDEAGGQQGRAR